MTDRELLEAAAKAAGITAVREFTFECDGSSSGECKLGLWNRDDGGIWNPLTDDGDALRLSAALKITISQPDDPTDADEVGAWTGRSYIWEKRGADPAAATRRAIVRAAAAIGESLQ